MSIHIEDKTTVGATFDPQTLETTRIDAEEGVDVVLGEYLEVLPNPVTDGTTRFGVYGYNETCGGLVNGKKLDAGVTINLTDGITATGTD